MKNTPERPEAKRAEWVRAVISRNPQRDLLRGLRSFRPEGSDTDRLAPTVPLSLRLALESLVHRLDRRKPVAHVAMWALSRGRQRIAGLPEIAIKRSARRALIDAGCEADIEAWAFALSGRDRKRLEMRRINPSDAGWCAEVALDLGVETSVIATMTIIAGIVDLPLPENLSRLLDAELLRFIRGLRRQAALAEDQQAELAAQPPRRVRSTPWDRFTREK